MIKKTRKFYKYKTFFQVVSFLLSLLPRSINLSLLTMMRHMPGNIGIAIRYCCIKNLCKRCGDNVIVFPGAYLTYLESCIFGNNISIHENCNIGCKGELTVGNNVMISQGTSILTTEHDYKQLSVPMRDASVICKSVTIGDDVWLGAHSIITAGTTIGYGAVIAAGAVVTKNIPPMCIAAGIPAHIIGKRVTTENQ